MTEDTNQVDLNTMFSQKNDFVNKETSFIEPRNGPSVLLKHNVSKKGINDLQKSKSTSYLNPSSKPVDLNLSKNLSKSNVLINDSFNSTKSPDLNKNQKSNHLLTSTPNLFKNHPSIIADNESSSLNSNFPMAIKCKNVSFDYQANKLHPTNILRDINLTCAIGSIYGLLGPSGCGKTTLIKLILGKYKPIAGTIKAFGYDVNDKFSGVIGSGVGYMPQELALIFDFTIEEHLTYFGRLYFMSYEKIRREINYLCRILDLPEKTRLVSQLSGGQQHRVSFACALIHKPRLLILDEPTVGLDPILRERIWKQLISLAKNFKITILITTHYIEEAKRADMLGFLRKGQLLVEQTPKFLMKKYETNSLESIFFKLCIEQIESKKAKTKLQHHIDVNFNNSYNEMIEKSFQTKQKPTTSSIISSDLNELKLTNDYRNEFNSNNSSLTTNSDETDDLFKIPWVDGNNRTGLSKWFTQFFAIIIKYFILTKRRPETVLAQYVLPIVAVATFCVCIGSTPTGIKIGVVNEEGCGFPLDMNQNFTLPIPGNSIEDFIRRLENLFTSSEDDKNEDPNRIKLRKRSIEEATTINLDIFNEDEVTTVYPSKFNLMNNLNFNENKNGSFEEKETKKLNDLLHGNEDISIDKTFENHSNHSKSEDRLNNHKLTSMSTNNMTIESTEHLIIPRTDSPIISDDEKEDIDNDQSSPDPMSVLSKETDLNSNNHSDEFSNENESTNEKLPTKIDDEEDDSSLDDEDLKSRLVNSQFEDACFSHDLIKKMNSFIFIKKPYDSFEKAIEDVRSGELWGVIRIKKGFSRAILSKILFQDYGDVNITNSLVEVNADATNKALVVTLEVALSRLYPEFIRDILVKANAINRKLNTFNHTDYKYFNLNSGRLPIVLGSHVFKAKFTLSDYFGIREFAAPGVLIILTYSISYALTVFSLVKEIGDKMFDRHQCIGLTSNQLIFSHLFTRFIFSASGTILVILLSVFFFDISSHGSLMNAVTLLLLQSYCAMTHGMLVSCLCPNLFICASISNGYLFFVFILSGVLWSFETLPPLMKQIGILLPSTIPCESLRTIMTRGQGFESKTVVIGYIVTIIWIFINYFLTIFVFNYRKNRK